MLPLFLRVGSIVVRLDEVREIDLGGHPSHPVTVFYRGPESCYRRFVGDEAEAIRRLFEPRNPDAGRLFTGLDITPEPTSTEPAR